MAAKRTGRRRGTRIAGPAFKNAAMIVVYIFALIGFITVLRTIGGALLRAGGEKTESPALTAESPEIREDYLTQNEYSRPGLALSEVNGIVVHYTANPGTTAEENRNYFENLATSHAAKVSCHYIIGLEGEILHIIPDDEMSYASNDRNSDTLAIECCHPDESGQFTNATYESLVNLVVYLAQKNGLSTKQVIRHYDVSGKNCPKYFVEHEEKWESFLDEVGDYVD